MEGPLNHRDQRVEDNVELEENPRSGQSESENREPFWLVGPWGISPRPIAMILLQPGKTRREPWYPLHDPPFVIGSPRSRFRARVKDKASEPEELLLLETPTRCGDQFPTPFPTEKVRWAFPISPLLNGTAPRLTSSSLFPDSSARHRDGAGLPYFQASMPFRVQRA